MHHAQFAIARRTAMKQYPSEMATPFGVVVTPLAVPNADYFMFAVIIDP